MEPQSSAEKMVLVDLSKERPVTKATNSIYARNANLVFIKTIHQAIRAAAV